MIRTLNSAKYAAEEQGLKILALLIAARSDGSPPQVVVHLEAIYAAHRIVTQACTLATNHIEETTP